MLRACRRPRRPRARRRRRPPSGYEPASPTSTPRGSRRRRARDSGRYASPPRVSGLASPPGRGPSPYAPSRSSTCPTRRNTRSSTRRCRSRRTWCSLTAACSCSSSRAVLSKTLLFNPTDLPGAAATPYFARLAGRIPERLKRVVSSPSEPLTEQLGTARASIRPASTTSRSTTCTCRISVRSSARATGASRRAFRTRPSSCPASSGSTGTICTRSSAHGSCATAGSGSTPTASRSRAPI